MKTSWSRSDRRRLGVLLALVLLLPNAIVGASPESRAGAVASVGSLFYPVTPCRLLDTRNPNGPLGGPSLQPAVARSFTLPPTCGIPVGAVAVSVNATVTNTTGPGQIVLFPGDIAAPGTSNLSFGNYQTRAAEVLVPLAADGSIGVLATGAAADFILDVGGYFAVSAGPGTVTLDAVPDQTIPTNTTLSLRLSGHSTDVLAALTYGLVAGPAGASVSPLGVFAFAPTQGQLGARSVTVQVRDGGGQSAQATFQVNVIDHDHPPVLGPLSDDLTRVGASYTKTLTATDPDAGDILTFSLLSGPAGMTLTGSTLSWTPTSAQLGNWPVRVKVTDHAGLSDSGQFNVGIQFLVATDDAYSVSLGKTLTINAPGVLGNDLDPLAGPLSATKLTNPDKGTLNAFNADGSFLYQAPAILPGPPFVPSMKFHLDGSAVGGSFPEAPLVIDVDGDGKPEIVALSGAPGFGIGAIHGTDGSFLWTRPTLPAPYDDCTVAGLTAGGLRHLAAADIDDSGQVSIVFPTSCGRDNLPTRIVGTNSARYAAINGKDGTFKWLSPPLGGVLDATGNPESFASGTVPTIARLRSGETPSILVGRDMSYTDFAGKPECDQLVPGWPTLTGCRGVFVLDGKDGTVRQRMAAPYLGAYPPDAPLFGNGTSAAVAADLDGDGSVEIIFGNAVFNNDGSVRWNNNDSLAIDCCGVNFWNGLGNFDDTPDIEVVRLEGGGYAGLTRLAVYKSDGSLLWALPLQRRAWIGIPTVADVDGTGRPSVVLSIDAKVCAIDYKGNYKWCHDAGSGLVGTLPNVGFGVGLQVFDLDGDGVPEVIVPLEGEQLLFLDGATGNVKATFDMAAANGPPFLPPYLDSTDGSGGPVVADVDGSGHAAIISIWGGIRRLNVVASATNDWRPARKVFNQESYQQGNVNDDGTVPKKFVNNFATPATNVFRNQGQILTPVDPLKKQQTSFTYTAADGTLTSAPGTVTITILPPNRPPKFVTTPPTRYVAPYYTFSYAAQAVDPDPGDTVTYSLMLYTGNGGGCSIDAASGVLSCAALFSADQSFVIVATDSLGAAAYQNFLLKESAGPATVPNVVGQTQAAAGATLTTAGFAPGNVTKIDDPAPAGQVLQQNPGAGTQALLGSNVDLVVSNGPAAPPPPPGPPPGLGNIKRIVVTPASTLHIVGENVPYKAISINNDGTGADITAFVVWSSTATAVATVNAAGIAHASAPGTTILTATAGGLSGQATLSVAARANGDNTPPTAIITQPASGGTVTGLTQILGTATDPHFLRYELALEASGDTTFTQIGQGTTQVTNGVLGTLDPTLLLNGAYILRLTVFDANGNSTTADVPILLDGGQKVGVFSIAYTDLTVPVAGLPIQVVRTYDSRDKRSGEFGVGWVLNVKTFRASASTVLGTGWQVVQQGTSFGLNPGSDHLVSVTLPSGEVETFDLRISPTSSFLVPFATLFATFVPRPGTLGTLQSLENVNLLILDPQPGPVTLVDDSTLNTFHPDRFLYTAVDGMQTIVTRTHGVESVRDTNGNQVTIGPSGITHSAGPGIAFTRDGSGRITAITDPKGQTQTYTYSPAGDLVAHTDATAASTSYFYNATHGLVRIQDPLGRPTARTDYDDSGRLLSITDAAGHTTTYNHDLPGRQEQVEDALGRVTLLNYDDRGNVLAVTDPLGHVATSTYDDLNNETSRMDPDGIGTSTAYNGAQPLNVIVDPGGLHLTTSNVFDASNRPTSVTDPAGRQFTFVFDGNGNITQANTPFGGTVTTAVNGQGLPISVSDALGHTTASTRDAFGNLTREDVLDAGAVLQRRREFTYDADGNKLTETLYRTVNGVLTPLTTSYGYDAAGRTITITDPAGGIGHIEYDALGRRTANIDALGRRTTYTYDDVGHNILTTYPDGNSIAAAYDAANNVVAQVDAAGRTTTFEYDALNRRTRTTLPDGSFTQTIYTPGGLVAATIDARGHRTDFTYDTAGRLTGTAFPAVPNGVGGPTVRPQVFSVLNATGSPTLATDPNGRQTAFQYDAAGRPSGATFADASFTTQSYDALGRRSGTMNEEGQTTSFTYDALGRVSAVAGLVGGETYSYDQADNLVAQTDALGRTTSFQYDALNRVVARTNPGGATKQLAYDAVGNVVARTDANGKLTTLAYDAMNRLTKKSFWDGSSIIYTYTPDGQRASATDGSGTTIYTYDSVGRLASVLHPTGETVHYARDANGNLLSLATPAATVTYAYDALNRLTQVNGPEGSTQSFFDLAGNRVRSVAANGILTDAVYDARNRPIQLTHQTAGSTVLQSFANVYSPSGRRSQVTEVDGSHEQYGFDARGRIVSETRTGVAPLTISHTYDAVGNRLQTVRNGATTNFTYDVDDRLQTDGTATYAYDAIGNLIATTVGPATTQYTYDPDNRLVGINDAGGATQYTYDADGNRVRAITPAGTTRFLVDAENNTGLSQVLEEKDAGGSLFARYTYGSERLALTQGTLSSFFHTDAQRSVRALTSATGAVTDRYQYDDYGRTVNATGTTNNPYRYGGERLDATGLYHLRARYYNPQLARFTSPDPLPGRLTSPASLHRYLYANADPVNYGDPTGLETGSLIELSIASGISEGVEAAYSIGSCIKAGCKALAVLDTVGNIIMWGGMAFSALAVYGLPVKATFNLVGINPAARGANAIKRVDIGIKYAPFAITAKLSHPGSAQTSINWSQGEAGSAGDNLDVRAAVPIYRYNITGSCYLPVGSVSLLAGVKIDLMTEGVIKPKKTDRLVVSLNALGVISLEYPLFEGVEGNTTSVLGVSQ